MISPSLLRYHMEGLSKFITILPGGGSCQFITILQWGAGLHKLWYPGIRDMSTWSKFGAHGEHGDVFLFSNLGAL